MSAYKVTHIGRNTVNNHVWVTVENDEGKESKFHFPHEDFVPDEEIQSKVPKLASMLKNTERSKKS